MKKMSMRTPMVKISLNRTIKAKERSKIHRPRSFKKVKKEKVKDLQILISFQQSKNSLRRKKKDQELQLKKLGKKISIEQILEVTRLLQVKLNQEIKAFRKRPLI